MALVIFLYGLAVGSFLNVLIFRLPKNKSLFGFSKCPLCRKKIAWPDNIPVLSFIFLKGRCRHCRLKISYQYPLVELAAGFLFLLFFLAYKENPAFLIYALFLTSLLMAIALIDFRHFVIPGKLVLAGFLVSFLYLLFINYHLLLPAPDLISSSFKDSLFGLTSFGGILWLLFLITKGKGLGFGDVILASFLGFVFGARNSIDLFYLSFFIGFIWGIIILASKKGSLKSKIPFGLVLGAAAIIFLLTGFNFLNLIDFELILRL